MGSGYPEEKPPLFRINHIKNVTRNYKWSYKVVHLGAYKTPKTLVIYFIGAVITYKQRLAFGIEIPTKTTKSRSRNSGFDRDRDLNLRF